MDFQEMAMYVNTKIADVINPVYHDIKKHTEIFQDFKV